MAVHCVKQLTYFGTKLDNKNEGEFVIMINSYIKEALEEFP